MPSGMSATLALLVDPDADTRSLYRAALEQEAWTVEEANDGREALAKTIAQRPELLVTETRLFGMDGFNLCVQIRADPEVYATSIVVVTETSTPDAIVHAHSSGADRVLIKPCAADRLLTTIAELRAQSRAIVQRSRQSASDLRERTLLTRERVVESRDLIRRSHHRFERSVTNVPPNPPPELACPVCNSRLLYERSYLGGRVARVSEQWDVFRCGICKRSFQYRHRTRKTTPFAQ